MRVKNGAVLLVPLCCTDNTAAEDYGIGLSAKFDNWLIYFRRIQAVREGSCWGRLRKGVWSRRDSEANPYSDFVSSQVT
jgi:hypothetical protein